MGQHSAAQYKTVQGGVPVRLAMSELMVTLGRSLFLTESGWNSSVSWRYLCFNVFFPSYVICYMLYVICYIS